jgi:hypothetical protein
MLQKTVLIFITLFFHFHARCGVNGIDTIPINKPDSTQLKPQNPKIALRRSAMIPGWGQLYNKQGWKLPIIYGALGVTAYIFFDNIKWYQRTRYAFNVRSKTNPGPQEIADINPRLINLTKDDLSFYRRQFRQDVDYSVLFFLGFWGLNVADAVVFAHLKNFDVSDRITGSLRVGNSSVAKNTGIQLQLGLHRKKDSFFMNKNKTK